MKHICELKNILAEHFDWNKSRLTVLANVLIGLFVVRTVNLSDLSTVLYSEAKISSNYKKNLLQKGKIERNLIKTQKNIYTNTKTKSPMLTCLLKKIQNKENPIGTSVMFFIFIF